MHVESEGMAELMVHDIPRHGAVNIPLVDENRTPDTVRDIGIDQGPGPGGIGNTCAIAVVIGAAQFAWRRLQHVRPDRVARRARNPVGTQSVDLAGCLEGYSCAAHQRPPREFKSTKRPLLADLGPWAQHSRSPRPEIADCHEGPDSTRSGHSN